MLEGFQDFMKIIPFKSKKPTSLKTKQNMSIAICKVGDEILMTVNETIELFLPAECAKKLGADLIMLSDPNFK